MKTHSIDHQKYATSPLFPKSPPKPSLLDCLRETPCFKKPENRQKQCARVIIAFAAVGKEEVTLVNHFAAVGEGLVTLINHHATLGNGDVTLVSDQATPGNQYVTIITLHATPGNVFVRPIIRFATGGNECETLITLYAALKPNCIRVIYQSAKVRDNFANACCLLIDVIAPFRIEG